MTTKVLGIPIDEASPPSEPDLYLRELKHESLRRQAADESLRSEFSELRTELKTDISELREEVSKGLKGSRAFLGILITLGTSLGPMVAEAVRQWVK